MATQALEAMLSHSAALTPLEQNLGDTDRPSVCRDASDDQSSGAPGCVRVEYRGICTYEVLEAKDEQSVVIEHGEAYALNRSTEGMRILMGKAPQGYQSIEVHTSCFGWGKSVNVFETRWTRLV